MKRKTLSKSLLVDLKKEIPALFSSKEEKLSGGFLSVSSTKDDGIVVNNNYVKGCVCNGVCSPTATPTATPTPTPTSTITVIVGIPG